MLLKRTYSALVTMLCVGTLAMAAEHAAAGERGKILASDSKPVAHNPVGGYVKKLDDGSVAGVKGLHKYYDDVLSQGRDVPTSIDAKLQVSVDRIVTEAKREFNATEVLAAVMESKTGNIVAMSSSNRYDPQHITSDDTPSLKQKFSDYPYEPGSVMQPIVLALAMEEGNVTSHTAVNPHNGRLKIGGHYTIIDDTKYEKLTAADVIVHSSNVGIAQISWRLSGKVFREGLKRFGFGSPSGIDLDRDLSGVLRSEEMLAQELHRANTAQGYGMMATFAQLLKAYSVFDNDGLMATPHMGSAKTQTPQRVLSAQTAEALKKILVSVVERGTGSNAKAEGLTIGGKTGTAHIAKNGRYTDSYHSSFYGFAEDGAGHSYTIGVLVIDPKAKGKHFASRSAVPVFKRVVEAMAAQGLLLPDKHAAHIARSAAKAETALPAEAHSKKVAVYRGAKTILPLKHAEVVKHFGVYDDPVYHIKVFNESVTLKSTDGNGEVYNVLEGEVRFAGKSSLLGNVVVMTHANKLHTVYAGLAHIAPALRVGQKLKQGYVIGKVKDKLVFQVTQDKKYVDPMVVMGEQVK